MGQKRLSDLHKKTCGKSGLEHPLKISGSETARSRMILVATQGLIAYVHDALLVGAVYSAPLAK